MKPDIAVASLRAEVLHVVKTACRDETGPALNRAALLKPFLKRGVSRATLHRWAEGAISDWLEELLIAVDQITGKDPRPLFVNTMKIYGSKSDWLKTAVVRQKENFAILDQARKHARLVKDHDRAARLLLAAAEESRRDIMVVLKLFTHDSNKKTAKMYRDDVMELVDRVSRDFPTAAEVLRLGVLRLQARWEKRDEFHGQQ